MTDDLNQALPFNGDTYLQAEVAQLICQYQIRTVVETGTHLGFTTKALAQMAKTVISIELNRDFYQQAYTNLQGYSNILLLPGNSPEVLENVLSAASGPLLFYLDAHWYNYWPLLDELRAIALFPQHRQCVVVIHDFFVPGTDFGYDSYNGQKLDWPLIQHAIFNLNPRAKYYYNQAANGARRGVVYIVPFEIKAL